MLYALPNFPMSQSGELGIGGATARAAAGPLSLRFFGLVAAIHSLAVKKKTPPSLPHRAACPRLILWPPALDPASRRRSASTAAWMCARLMASGFSAWRVRSTYSNFIASLRHRSSALRSPASPATAAQAVMMRLKWQCGRCGAQPRREPRWQP